MRKSGKYFGAGDIISKNGGLRLQKVRQDSITDAGCSTVNNTDGCIWKGSRYAVHKAQVTNIDT